MPLEVAAIVLVAAAMHATWNALVKRTPDPLIGQTLVVGGGALLLTPLAFAAPLPSAADLPYLAASTVFHTGYYSCLAAGYRHGDLALVYPIARGSAPLLVTALALLYGEPVGSFALIGVAAISLGILALGFESRTATKPIGFALATGLFIAGYSWVDARGVRNAASTLSYLVWLHVATAIPIGAYVCATRGRRLLATSRSGGWRALCGGGVAMLGYGLVLWAYRRTAIPPVAALRETSVLIATFIAAASLHEPVGPLRWIAAALVAMGIALVVV